MKKHGYIKMQIEVVGNKEYRILLLPLNEECFDIWERAAYTKIYHRVVDYLDRNNYYVNDKTMEGEKHYINLEISKDIKYFTRCFNWIKHEVNSVYRNSNIYCVL